MRRSYLERTADQEVLKASNKQINEVHPRRSNLILNATIDNPTSEKPSTDMGVTQSKDLSKSVSLKKTHKKCRGSRSPLKNKNVKSSYRSLFRSKKSNRGCKGKESPDSDNKSYLQAPSSNQAGDLRRKTFMHESANNLRSEVLKKTLNRMKTQTIDQSENLMTKSEFVNSSSRNGPISH